MNDEMMRRITISSDICHGKPCVRGLHYPVEFLELMSSGMKNAEILDDYDDLEPEDLIAVISFVSS